MSIINLINIGAVCSFFLTLFSLVVIPLQTVFFFLEGGERGGVAGNGYTVFTSIRPPNPDSLVSLKYLEKANDGIMFSKPKVIGGGGILLLVWIPLASALLIVCTLSPEPMAGFGPKLHRHIIGREVRSD